MVDRAKAVCVCCGTALNASDTEWLCSECAAEAKRIERRRVSRLHKWTVGDFEAQKKV